MKNRYGVFKSLALFTCTLTFCGLWMDTTPALSNSNIVGPIFEQAKLTASDGAAHDLFGNPVAIDGNTIVVGAPSGGTSGGAAYVFQKNGLGWSTMTEIAQLTAGDGNSGDYFGSSVAIEGETIVVGADSAVSSGSTRAGAAYVYVRPVTGWTDMTQTAKLRPDL